MQYLKDICHIQSIKVTITPTELVQKAPKSGDLSPLNSVQLLRENISHKQTMTKKTCHENICFPEQISLCKNLFQGIQAVYTGASNIPT